MDVDISIETIIPTTLLHRPSIGNPQIFANGNILIPVSSQYEIHEFKGTSFKKDDHGEGNGTERDDNGIQDGPKMWDRIERHRCIGKPRCIQVSHKYPGVFYISCVYHVVEYDGYCLRRVCRPEDYIQHCSFGLDIPRLSYLGNDDSSISSTIAGTGLCHTDLEYTETESPVGRNGLNYSFWDYPKWISLNSDESCILIAECKSMSNSEERICHIMILSIETRKILKSFVSAGKFSTIECSEFASNLIKIPNGGIGLMDYQPYDHLIYSSHGSCMSLLDVSKPEKKFEIVCGNPTKSGFKDGPSMDSLFYETRGLLMNSDFDFLLIADHGNNAVRKLDFDTFLVSTLALNASNPFSLSPQSLNDNRLSLASKSSIGCLPQPFGLCWMNQYSKEGLKMDQSKNGNSGADCLHTLIVSCEHPSVVKVIFQNETFSNQRLLHLSTSKLWIHLP